MAIELEVNNLIMMNRQRTIFDEQIRRIKMPYNLRTKLKHLAHKCELTDKECERLIKALDTVDAVEEIKAEIKHLHDWAFNREEVIKIIDKHISRKE